MYRSVDRTKNGVIFIFQFFPNFNLFEIIFEVKNCDNNAHNDGERGIKYCTYIFTQNKTLKTAKSESFN